MLTYAGLRLSRAGNVTLPGQTAHPVTVSYMERETEFSSAQAENLAVALACVNVISANMASFPLLIYERDGLNRREAGQHWLLELVRHGPNQNQVWGALLESAVASVELAGNALIEIVRNSDGSVAELRFIPWAWVQMQLLPSGRVAFDVYEPSLPGTAAIKRRLLADDAIHLKDRSDDGYIGRSRLSRSGDVLRTARAQQTFARSFLERGAQPSGVIKHLGAMTAEQRTSLREQFRDRHEGAGNAGRTLILEGGLEWQAAQISPEDAELLASRRFAVEEIARVYGVPPPLVGDLSHGTFTNSREAARWFGQFTLTPRVRRLEAELMLPHRTAANMLRKRLRALMQFAVRQGMATGNPVIATKPYKVAGTGFHTWSEEEIARYEARHPVGSKARLALDLMLWTGQRGGDARLMGPPNVRNKRLVITQEKTGATVSLPILPALAESIMAAPSGGLVFLLSEHGKPFSRKGFGNKMRQWCDEAGLPQCAAHGLRKSAARRFAEAGCSNQMIKAWTGHTTDSEVSRYTAAADQELLSDAAAEKLMANLRERLANNNANSLKKEA